MHIKFELKIFITLATPSLPLDIVDASFFLKQLTSKYFYFVFLSFFILHNSIFIII
jgi:hypothetical protein